MCAYVLLLLALSLLSSSLLSLSEDVPSGLVFMIVVQPRRVVFHPNALAHGWQMVEALIALAEVVQVEVGPPVPGTYRHDFMNDREPRQVPMSARGNVEHFAAMSGPTQTEDIAAMEVATRMMPGALHDMSRLPAPVWEGLARTVVVGGLRAFLQS